MRFIPYTWYLNIMNDNVKKIDTEEKTAEDGTLRHSNIYTGGSGRVTYKRNQEASASFKKINTALFFEIPSLGF